MGTLETDRISPYLLYEDAGAALEWICRALGFEERHRVAGPDGRVLHADVALGSAVVMLGCPGGGYVGPGKKGYCNAYVYVYVDDVDAHCARARDAGATIASEPADQDYGDRRYECTDPEGHRWFFAQRL